ncbi:MAG: ParB/RepB/Spo0J family partition protein, partial [Bdellovibrionales bacterium]|nr:ParB/RepB/Spo0J family partition protein [Bdellovibrionales bacterium]
GSLLGEPREDVVEIDLPTEEFQVENIAALKEGFIEGKKNSPAIKEKKAETVATKDMEPRIPETARIWQIPIHKIVQNKKQPRKVFEGEALKELAASIKEKGILQPIVCRKLSDNQFEIIAGERRWRASQMAGIQEVPVILKEADEQNVLELALIENIQRENLNPIEEAQAYYHLIKEYGLTQQKLAEKIGKERGTIANLLRLLNLAPDVRKMLAGGEIALGQAKVILGVADLKVQKDIAIKVKNLKLSVRATEKLVAKYKQGETEVSEIKSVDDVDISKKLVKGLSSELQKLLGTKVSIGYLNGKGKISIHFYSDDELNNYVDKIRKTWQK